MKRNKFVHKCGPYKVISISQMPGGVRLEVYPAFPQYAEREQKPWAVSREEGEGGGPSIFSAMALAEQLENFLNQAYDGASITAWKGICEDVQKRRVSRNGG